MSDKRKPCQHTPKDAEYRQNLEVESGLRAFGTKSINAFLQ